MKEFISTVTTCVHSNQEQLAEIQFKIVSFHFIHF